MLWELWGKTIFSGFAGSVVGFVSAVIVLLISRKLERRADEDKQAREELAAVLSHAAEVNPNVGDGETRELIKSLLLFGAAHRLLFPHTAAWCRYQAHELMDFEGAGNYKASAWQAGFITVSLTEWFARDKPDARFSKVDWDKIMLEKIKKRQARHSSLSESSDAS